MEIITSPLALQKLRKTLSMESFGFVPTMGALHAGHFHLVQKSLSENERTVVSIFVNPTQFNSSEDLAKYPRTLEEDQTKLQKLGVDFLFLPSFESMYPDHYAFSISEKTADSMLCGSSRPGHFTGVLTVVLKLLNIVDATKAYFGEKDFQQLSLIQRMADAFFLSTQIVPVPTVRDSEGLALSSRNQRLSPEGLKKARLFAQILNQKRNRSETLKAFEEQSIQVDYLEDHQQRRFAAVFIDNVRLIDNVPL